MKHILCADRLCTQEAWQNALQEYFIPENVDSPFEYYLLLNARLRNPYAAAILNPLWIYGEDTFTEHAWEGRAFGNTLKHLKQQGTAVVLIESEKCTVDLLNRLQPNYFHIEQGTHYDATLSGFISPYELTDRVRALLR